MNTRLRSFARRALAYAFVIAIAAWSANPKAVPAADPAQPKKKTVAEYDADIDRARAAIKLANQRGDTTALRKADAELRSAGNDRQVALMESAQAANRSRLPGSASGSSGKPDADPADDVAGSSSTLRANDLRDVEEPLGIYGGKRVNPLAGYDNDLPDIEDDRPPPGGGLRLRDIRPIGPATADDDLLEDGFLEDLVAQMGAPDYKVPSGKLIIKGLPQKIAGKALSAAEKEKWYKELRDIQKTANSYGGRATQAQIKELGRRQEHAFSELRRMGDNPTFGGTQFLKPTD